MKSRPVVNHTPGSSAPMTDDLDDQDILDNIDGRMHGPMRGFIDKFFGDFQFIHHDAFLEIAAAGRACGRCAIPSAAPSTDNFLQWLTNYTSRERDGARGSWHVYGGDGVASEHKSRDDEDGARLVLIMDPNSPDSDTKPRWENVQVIGQFQRHDGMSYQDGLLRLCRSAHHVFASQPTRLFLHGFYIRDSLVELWVFDRSGLYCSDLLDIHRDFIQVLFILLTYQRMTDQDFGNGNIFEVDSVGRYIVTDSLSIPPSGKLYIESQPIASRSDLVGTGTSCYRARLPDSQDWKYVVKFKWRWARERPEEELLKMAANKGVWGATSLDHYQELEATANLRRGLRWVTHRKFTRLHGRGEQASSTTSDGFLEHTEETDDFFQNRILACMITSPVGRPLYTFQSCLELLQVFRDAIKCHRSLYRDGGILHQDVSHGNVIILDGQEQGKPRGILIDLDSAINLDDEVEETETGSITGTRPFMAIGVLKRERHTYRHDLESFLYVLLWIIITNHTESLPETSKLRNWSRGEYDELAVLKSRDMEEEEFQTILDEFPPEMHSLKTVGDRLRQVLFPLRNGVMWTGTDGSPEAVDQLYEVTIRAFEDAIVFEGWR